MREDNVDSFLRRVNRQSRDTGFLREVVWELTGRCNLRCGHCYLPQNRLKRGGSQLGLAEIKKIINQLFRLSCLELTFTGGEVFMRPDILEILSFAKEKGFLVTVITNAVLLDEKNIRRISMFGKGIFLNVTLNTLSEKTSRVMTGVEGALAKTLNAITLLKTYAISFSVSTLVTRHNFRELDALIKFCAKLGVHHNQDYYLHPRQNQPSVKNKNQISYQQIKQLISRDFGPGKNDFCRADSQARRLKSGQAVYCEAGNTSMYISQFGRAGLCIDFPLPKADTLKIGVDAAWQKVRAFAQSLKAPPGFKCVDCDLVNECAWCPAMGWIYHKNPFACVDFHKKAARAVAQVVKAGMDNG